MTVFPDVLIQRLKQKERQMSHRTLSIPQGIDFSSNDYLGFCNDLNLKKIALSYIADLPLGSSASRLLRGHSSFFEKTEQKLASFSSKEDALFFPSGYQANVGLFSALLTPEDLVFSDELNHASIIDGIRLSGARKKIYPHIDTSALRELLKTQSEFKNNHQLKVIVTESLFSMDGDRAPLEELILLAEEFGALLIVDEAHATGLWGEMLSKGNPLPAKHQQGQLPFTTLSLPAPVVYSGQLTLTSPLLHDMEVSKTPLGGGLVQALGLSDRVFATIHPAGKAMGVSGAWVASSSAFKEYLVNYCRAFIFSTAPLPAMFGFLNASVDFWETNGPSRSQEVLQYASLFKTALQEKVSTSLNLDRLIPLSNLETPILPLLLGKNELALRTALYVQERGFDVKAIRPPTVPESKARLRITFHWNQSHSEIQQLAYCVAQALNQLSEEDWI